MYKTNSICVFCSSRNVGDAYTQAAEKLAQLLSEREITLVYGGANVGIMGILARAMLKHNSKVIGVIPHLIFKNNLAETSLKQLVVTEDMKSRKAKMHELSDAFIALPGGFGTLEELLEIITLKQLNYHNKPIVIVNTNGFYDKLNELFEQLYTAKFAGKRYRALYHLVDNVEDAMNYIDNYKPHNLKNKWKEV